tara:strand:+ start:18 stop:1952 length:1935 start_codon:yes stop_codon:yes gene_type:complete
MKIVEKKEKSFLRRELTSKINLKKILKNKNEKKILYLSLILIISVFLSTIIWGQINLSLDSSFPSFRGISQKNYHPQNDTLRFFIFIIIAILPFLTFFLNFYKQDILKIKEIINIKLDNFNNKKYRSYHIKQISLLILLFTIINFLILDFENLGGPIDIFHEGAWLTPSNNFLYSNGFWTNSFVERGLFGNFYPVLIWKLLDIQTIGSTRFMELILLLSNKLFLIILAAQITININYEKYEKILFFLILSCLFIGLIDYHDSSHFTKRSVLFLFFLNIVFLSLYNGKISFFFKIVTGFFSATSFFWFIDIGIYINILIILLLTFFIIRKDFKNSFLIFLGVFLSWIFFYSFLSLEEFQQFFVNTSAISSTIESVGGFKYPDPFFSGDTRATKALIFFVIGGIFVINSIFLKKTSFSNNFKIFLIILFLVSLISFKYALGYSDSGHIQVASAPIILILYIGGLYYFFNFCRFVKGKKKFNEFLSHYKSYFLFVGIIFLIMYFNLFAIDNLLKFKNRISNIIFYKDEFFLKSHFSDYKGLVKYYKKIDQENNCIQIFTDEAAIPYLMRKKSCTKYYMMVTASPKKIQEDFIVSLKTAKPKIILYKSELYEWTNPPASKRLHLVNKFLNENYEFHSKFKKWTFIKLK